MGDAKTSNGVSKDEKKAQELAVKSENVNEKIDRYANFETGGVGNNTINLNAAIVSAKEKTVDKNVEDVDSTGSTDDSGGVATTNNEYIDVGEYVQQKLDNVKSGILINAKPLNKKDKEQGKDQEEKGNEVEVK